MMNKNESNHFRFPAVITRDHDTANPTRLVDREVLLTELREYVRQLSSLPASQASDARPQTSRFDPAESGYIHWDQVNKRRAVYGAARLFPQVIRVISADDANLIQFGRHPEYDTFIHLARGTTLVALDLVTTLRRDLAEWYNQAAFGSLAGAVIRRGGAIWIVGAETPAHFRKRFSDLYRVLRRLGVRSLCVGDNDGKSGSDEVGGSDDDA